MLKELNKNPTEKENKELNTWVHRQRNVYKKGKLTPERIKKL